MDTNRTENPDCFDGFVTPKLRQATKGSVKPLISPQSDKSDSETESVFDNDIAISPRRGRSADSRNDVVNNIPRSSTPRRSSSQTVSKDDELKQKKRVTRSCNSSDSESSSATRKRFKRTSTSSSNVDSSESERASDSEQTSTLHIRKGVTPKKQSGRNTNRQIQRSSKEKPNAPCSSKTASSSGKKNVPKPRRTRTTKLPILKTNIQPSVILRQNEKSVLISIDNTEPVAKVDIPLKTLKKGVVNTAGVSPTNLFNSSQIMEGQSQTTPPISPEVSLQPEQDYVIILNNRLFKFDALIPDEIQDLSDAVYIHSCGSISKERLMSCDPKLEFEEVCRLPMKISSFISLYGTYFGHKMLVGDTGKKVIRKGLKDSNISNSFYVYCKICFKLLACTGGAFNNFTRHLQDAHGLVDPSKLNLGVLSLDESGSVVHIQSERYKWDNPRQVVGLDLLLQYIMDSNLPFANIEKFSLKRLLNFFDPQFKLPSSVTLHALLSKRVETEVIPSLNKTLQSVTSATLVVDAWSSRSMQGVLAVSIIFLDEDFVWKQRSIAISRLTGSHTAFNIGEKIKAAIKRWKLDGKIRFVVSDGGGNMVKCLADLHEESLCEEMGLSNTTESNPTASAGSSISANAPFTFENESVKTSIQDCSSTSTANSTDTTLEEITQGFNEVVSVGENSNALGFFGDHQNLSTLIFQQTDQEKTIELSKLDEFLYTENLKPSKCVAHTLQRVLAVGIQKNEKASKIHKQIKKISTFGRKRQVVREITKALLGKVVIRPGDTRWNSVVDSGWTLIEPSMFNIMKSLIDDAHEKSSEKMRVRLPDRLTDTFAMELKEFLNISDPLCKLTDELQANGITAHMVIPGIARTYEAIKNTNIDFMEDYREIILRLIEKKMKKFVTDKDFIFATVLCPYYKYHFFELYFEEQPSNALQLMSLDDVKELCLTHLQTADEMIESFNSQRSQPTLSLSTNCSYAQKIQEREKQRLENIDNKKSDLEKYVKGDISGDSPNVYWQRKRLDFPRLFEKAREIYCKPATSGLVERLFSLIADINTPDRVNLHVKTLEEIIMYKEFIDVPKSYKEATTDVFKANDEQLAELVNKLSVQTNFKKTKKNTLPAEKSTKNKRSSKNAPVVSVQDD